MADQDNRTFLRGNRPLGCGDVIGKQDGWVLHDRDVVPLPLQYVVDAIPTGPVHKTAVDENDVLDPVCHWFNLLF